MIVERWMDGWIDVEMSIYPLLKRHELDRIAVILLTVILLMTITMMVIMMRVIVVDDRKFSLFVHNVC